MSLHRFFFSLLLFLLPTQLGRHFWPDFAYVLGLRVDYLAPTIYLTDLLVLAMLGAWVIENRKAISDPVKLRHGASKKKWIRGFLIKAGLVFAFLFTTSLFVAQNRGAALYFLLKLLEFSALGFYLVKTGPRLSQLFYPLSAAVSWASLLALAQFVKQQSLGGPFWWLGERTFSVSTPGIARQVLDGQIFLRSYSTFPHPNVLAGFLVVCLILLWGARLKGRLSRTVLGATTGLAIMAVITSFSHAAWLVGVALIIIWLSRPWIRPAKIRESFFKAVLPIGILVSFLAFILAYYFFGLDFLSFPLSGPNIGRRAMLSRASFSMIGQYPLTGVGLNNFIPRLPEFTQIGEAIRFLQPVHNIYLLIAAETGLVGLIIFLWLIYRIIRFQPKRPLPTTHYPLLYSIAAILALGIFDHYFATLQQTQLLATLVFSLSWSKASSVLQ